MVRDLSPGQDISLQGEEATSVCIVLEGLICSYEVVNEGSRQIQAYHIAGDVPDLFALYCGMNASSLCALRPSKIAFITHPRMHKLMSEHPVISECIWRKGMIDAAIAKAWISNIGRRLAVPRLAHLFCELLSRFRELGIASDTIPFALTQLELGDSQGLSEVHTNRTMTVLKERGLIRMTGRLVKVMDWDGLAEEADFDPTYLHLERRGVHGPPRAKVDRTCPRAIMSDD